MKYNEINTFVLDYRDIHSPYLHLTLLNEDIQHKLPIRIKLMDKIDLLLNEVKEIKEDLQNIQEKLSIS